MLVLRHDLASQRIVSVAATALLLGVAVLLYASAGDGAPRAYLLGDWPAPFGIVLVLDRLSATMVLLTALLAVAVVIYAMAGWDRRGRHFHPLFQFQLMGLNGAFLTGDVFNLFVFFEVMLIASYGLMLHGGGPRRLRAGFHYVAINLVGSTLFLFAVGADLRRDRHAQHGRPRRQGGADRARRRSAPARRRACCCCWCLR